MSKKDIIVLGKLEGSAYAGADGNPILLRRFLWSRKVCALVISKEVAKEKDFGDVRKVLWPRLHTKKKERLCLKI